MSVPSTPLVEIRDLVVSYEMPGGALRALDEVELTLRREETLALVGESGSGKSTLALAVGRLLPPEARWSQGGIRVAGLDLARATPEALRELRRAQLGFIFQDPMQALNPTMRIARQVARAMGGAPRPEAVAALLAKADLAEPERVMRAYPFELSGGMAQRVVIAMAIARRPSLLIADEPTAALDAAVGGRVMQRLSALRREGGASLLLLSHDLALVARHADRIAVLYGGRVVEAGPTAEVLAAPAHPYTRALIAASAGRARPGLRLSPIPGLPPLLQARAEACSYAPRCAQAMTGCCDRLRPLPQRRGARELLCHLGFPAAPSLPVAEGP